MKRYKLPISSSLTIFGYYIKDFSPVYVPTPNYKKEGINPSVSILSFFLKLPTPPKRMPVIIDSINTHSFYSNPLPITLYRIYVEETFPFVLPDSIYFQY